MEQKSQTDIRKIIADRLKLARKEAGFTTPSAFCKQYCFDLSRYQEHENAMIPITASALMQYGIALNISFTYLILGENLNHLK